MLDQHALDAGVIQAVLYRQDMCTGHSEDKLDTQLLQIFYDQFADLDFHEYTTEKIFRAIVIVSGDFHTSPTNTRPPRITLFIK